MIFIEKMFTRRSIRKFTDEQVSEEVMLSILEAGRLSPSATNTQPWHFIVARDRKAKEACTFAGFNRFAVDASFVVVGVYKKSEAVMERYSLMDVTIALQSMVIAGWVQGVGSCWMGAFDENNLRNSLNLPADARIVGAIAFGMPAEMPKQPPKKTLDEIVHFDEW
jgi:nitroreductase